MRHIHSGDLTTRLNKLFSTRAARLGALHELTKLAPVAIKQRPMPGTSQQ